MEHDNPEFYFNDHVVRPEDVQSGGHLHHTDASNSNFILIRGTHLLNQDEQQQLIDLNVQVTSMVDGCTYLCRYEPADLDVIRQKPFILFANVVTNDLTINQHLKEKLATADDADVFDVRIVLFHESAIDFGHVANHMVDELHIPRDRITSSQRQLSAHLHKDEIRSVAQLDDVMAVEETRQPVVFNNLVANVVKLPFTSSTGSGIRNRYQGTGQVIGVADSGFSAPPTATFAVTPGTNNLARKGTKGIVDRWGHGTHVVGTILGSYEATATSTTEFTHDTTLLGRMDGIAPGAKLYFQNIQADPVTLSDMTTTVLGSAKTMANLTKSDIQTLLQKGIFMGPSYVTGPSERVHLGAVSLPVDGVLGICDDAYQNGVRIHNNSWGTPLPAYQKTETYNANAQDVDNFVYDKKVKNREDFLIIRAAGNDGDKPLRDEGGQNQNRQLLSYGLAKNGLTIGACYSDGRLLNADDPTTWSEYAGAAAHTVTISSTNVANFSSRGPGRGSDLIIKPDLIAPGVATYSLRSPLAESAWNGGDKCLQFMSGTSMAAPVVTGCAALVREALLSENKSWTTVAASLIKALLINGAVDLAGGHVWGGGRVVEEGDSRCENLQWDKNDASAILPRLPAKRSGAGRLPIAIPAAPNGIQGWGRIDMEETMKHLGVSKTHGYRYFTDKEQLSLAPGGRTQLSFDINIDKTKDATSANLSVTVVYTDAPGAAVVYIINLTLKPAKDRDMSTKTAKLNENNSQRLRLNGLKIRQKVEVVIELLNSPASQLPLSLAVAWSITFVT